MDTGIIIRECVKSLECVNTEKEKHLHIFVDHDYGIISGYIKVEGLIIVTFKKG